MGIFSGLSRPHRPGVDGFLDALRDKVARDRMMAAQAIVRNDPAEAVRIRQRSQAIEARRAEAKARAQLARMAAMGNRPLRTTEMPTVFEPRISTVNDLGLHGRGPGPETMQLAATQEAFERQQDRRVAEERARATGRDAEEVYREMRGLGQQGPSRPETPPNPSGFLPPLAVREVEALMKPEPPRVPPAGYVPSGWRPNGSWSAEEVNRHAVNAMRMYDVHIAGGMNPIQAAGWAANAEAESGGNYRRAQDSGGPAYGLFQWERARRRRFEEKFGHPMEQSTEKEQLAFRDFELKHDLQGAGRRIDQATTAGDHAAAVTHYYEIPNDRNTAAADRSNLAEAIVALAQARERAPRR